MNSPIQGTGMGDLPPRPDEPLETYNAIARAQQILPRRAWILAPQVDPRFIQGLEKQQMLIRHELMPDLWKMLVDFLVMQSKQVHWTKNPNWIDPPASAEMFDLRNETAVAVGAVNTTIVTYTVPDRYLVVLWKFGHRLSVISEWGTPIWNIFINNRPVRTFQEFRQQAGTFTDPTRFEMPVIAPPRTIITVTARTGGAATDAYARLMGYQFPVKTVTQDGTYQPFFTL